MGPNPGWWRARTREGCRQGWTQAGLTHPKGILAQVPEFLPGWHLAAHSESPWLTIPDLPKSHIPKDQTPPAKFQPPPRFSRAAQLWRCPFRPGSQSHDFQLQWNLAVISLSFPRFPSISLDFLRFLSISLEFPLLLLPGEQQGGGAGSCCSLHIIQAGTGAAPIPQENPRRGAGLELHSPGCG